MTCKCGASRLTKIETGPVTKDSFKQGQALRALHPAGRFETGPVVGPSLISVLKRWWTGR